MLLARLCHAVATVALGYHHKAGAIVLELVNVWVHAVCRSRSHRATRITLWCLGWSGIEYWMILEVCRHLLACIKTCLELGVSDVAGNDDGTLEVNASAYGIFCKLGTHGINTLVKVYLYALGALARTAQLLGDKLCGVLVHLLKPDTVLVDFCLYVSVGRAAHTHTDRTACSVAWQADNSDVVGKMLASELCSESNLVCFLQQLVLKVDVTERPSRLVACGRQVVIVLDACELHREQVLLCRCATNYEGYVVGRTCSRSERLHLLYEERQQCALVLYGSLCHGIEVGLVGRSTTLCHHDEPVLSSLHCLYINLGWQVAAGVHLIVHVEGSILRVAQVVLSIRVVDTERQSLLVLKASPYLLSFLAMNDGRTSILAEGQHALNCSLSIAQELQSHILVVLAGLRVSEDSCHLLVVGTAQHKLTVVEGLLSQKGQCLLAYFQNLVPLEVGCADSVL